MQLLHSVRPGHLEAVVGCLPTFLGVNITLMHGIITLLKQEMPEGPLEEAVRLRLEERMIEMLCEHFPYIKGLKDLLYAARRAEVLRG